MKNPDSITVMTDEERIRRLLEKLLDSQATPEEVCHEFPEMLASVRARWERLKRVQQQVDSLFPSTDADGAGKPEAWDARPPQIEGYDVRAILGRGGMGIVYKALHRKLQRDVAVKTLITGAHASGEDRARLVREAEAVAGLQHPNIVQVHDVGELDGRPYFTMELVEGGSLAQRLAGAPQPARQSARLVATLASAVSFAHEHGVVHRDLKPANILLSTDGTPKIADFGLARREGTDQRLTLDGTRLGTPSYMAPEQALGRSGEIGPPADVYALGAILYEMLTGRPPFRADTALETERQVIDEEPARPSRLNASVPRDLETICLKCLHKEPQRRYASAANLAEDLERFLDGRPVHARPVALAERREQVVPPASGRGSAAGYLRLSAGGRNQRDRLELSSGASSAERVRDSP